MRRPIAEARAAELAEHYARILGRQADHRVSAVVRTCLRRLPARLPIRGGERRAVEALIERVLRLGDVGSLDLVGASSQIDADITRRLGEAAGDPRGVYRALRAMLGHTALVVRHSRQIWELRLAGLADATSEVHRALVAETPALYCLPMADAVAAEPVSASQGKTSSAVEVSPPGSDPSAELLAELARIRDELTAERHARAEADQRRRAAEAELDLQRRAWGEERQALEEAGRRAQEAALALAEVRRELDGIRQAQAADADKLRELFEARRIPEAATYLAARMLGLNLDESAQGLLSLVRSAVAEDAPMAPAVPTLNVAPAPAATPTATPVVAELPPPALASSGATEPPPPPPRRSPVRERPLTSQAPVFAAIGVDRDQPRPAPDLSSGKVGRNSPCPCGSGKKFKRCCGPLAG
ncbi:MAG: SEC-C domain-containing protein [Myxococcales bacterium]|nr:SEC-C domain-containing protein [Myxococcales bacterium]